MPALAELLDEGEAFSGNLEVLRRLRNFFALALVEDGGLRGGKGIGRTGLRGGKGV